MDFAAAYLPQLSGGGLSPPAPAPIVKKSDSVISVSNYTIERILAMERIYGTEAAEQAIADALKSVPVDEQKK